VLAGYRVLTWLSARLSIQLLITSQLIIDFITSQYLIEWYQKFQNLITYLDGLIIILKTPNNFVIKNPKSPDFILI
jgi:hypothetical protein